MNHIDDPFDPEFFEKVEGILSDDRLYIEHLWKIIKEDKRKLNQCITKDQLRTLCVQLIVENENLKRKFSSIVKLVEEYNEQH